MLRPLNRALPQRLWKIEGLDNNLSLWLTDIHWVFLQCDIVTEWMLVSIGKLRIQLRGGYTQ